MAQDGGILAQGTGWVYTKDSCLTISKDYDGERIDIDGLSSWPFTEKIVIEEGVTSTEKFQWGSGSYQYCNWLSSITIPRSMTSLVIMRKYYDELECWGRSYSYFAADTVICLSEVPPSVDNGVFLRGYGILQSLRVALRPTGHLIGRFILMPLWIGLTPQSLCNHMGAGGRLRTTPC